MKIILKNSNLVFQQASGMRTQSYTKTLSSALDQNGAIVSAGAASFITELLPARDYVVSGSFSSNNSTRSSIVWYGSGGENDIISHANLPHDLEQTGVVVENHQLTAPSGAVYVRFAATYGPTTDYNVDLLLKYEI
jgi:hypothetical protein